MYVYYLEYGRRARCRRTLARTHARTLARTAPRPDGVVTRVQYYLYAMATKYHACSG